MSDNLKSEIVKFFSYRFNLDTDRANEEEVVENIRRGVVFKGTNLWTLIFAIFIASIGLNVNSTAVIIGAMLISPLMGPIMGIGLGAGIFDFQLIKHSAKNLAFATLIALLTSAFYFFLSPLDDAQSEILARTTPTIWDVLIAFFGGMAGIVASSRKNFTSVIPGVAIATALMPPLCTAGFGLGTGNFSYFFGAFYLYLINCVFISIATFLMIRFLKFKPVHLVDAATESKMQKVIWTFALFTILPSLYLAYRFVGQEIFKQKVQRFITSEIEAGDMYVINKTIDPVKKSIGLLVYGDAMNDSLMNIINRKKEQYGLDMAVLNIRYTQNGNAYKKELSDMKSGLLETIYTKQVHEISRKDRTIDSLTHVISNLQDSDLNNTEMYNEFNALFGETKELAFIRSTFITDEGDTDTLLYVIFSPVLLKPVNQKQMENWLKTKSRLEIVKIIERR